MEDWDPKSHPTDAVAILLQGIGVDRKEAIAKVSLTWPDIEWDDLETEPVFGSLKVRHLTLDVSLNLNGRDYPSLCLDSNPEGNYFDLEFVGQILAICEKSGWIVTFFDSVEDEYV